MTKATAVLAAPVSLTEACPFCWWVSTATGHRFTATSSVGLTLPATTLTAPVGDPPEPLNRSATRYAWQFIPLLHYFLTMASNW